MSISDAGTPKASPSPHTDPLVGQLVGGRYRVQERLAAGGMGVVYRAIQEPLGRAVAIKVLRQPEDPRLDKSYAERFLREAAVVAHLNHPNTVVVHDYGNDGANLYFAMEYLEGKTLTQRVYELGAMAPVDALRVARQIASSLGEAHEGGLVHRDLKPGNVMICPRRHDPLFVKVLDFGLVKLVSEEEAKKLTQSGITLGSPRYMSPEQIRATTPIDHRADVYAFGALMTFCLTGKPPFPDGSQFEAMRHHVYTAPPALRTLEPRCTASAELEQVVLRCLAKEPDARPQTMGEVLAALDRCPEATEAPTEGYDSDGGRTSVDLSPPGAMPSHPPMAPGPAPTESSSISQLSSSWFRRADGSPLDAFGWLIRGLVALTIVLAGAAAAFFAPGGEEAPTAPPPVSSEALPTSPPTAPGTHPGTATEDEAPPTGGLVQLRSVELLSEPSGAQVLRGDELLGNTPLAVEVSRGEALELTLVAEGHRWESVTVDGSEGEVSVQLTPTGDAPRPTRSSRRERPERTTTRMGRAAPAEGASTGVIRDPWE